MYRRDLVLGLGVTRTSSRCYSRDLATRTRISSRPMLTDPYEDRCEKILLSTIKKYSITFQKIFVNSFIVRYSLVI